MDFWVLFSGFRHLRLLLWQFPRGPFSHLTCYQPSNALKSIPLLVHRRIGKEGEKEERNVISGKYPRAHIFDVMGHLHTRSSAFFIQLFTARKVALSRTMVSTFLGSGLRPSLSVRSKEANHNRIIIRLLDRKSRNFVPLSRLIKWW